MALEPVISDLFSYNIHVPMEEKNCDSPVPSTAENGDSESVSSIYGLLGGAFLTMFAGRNKNLPVYIPLEEIRAACREIDGNSDELIDRLLREQVPDERQEKVYGEHIMEDGYIRQYFLLFLVDCSQKSGSGLLEPLMSSPKLVDILWEKALIEPAAGSDA